MRHPDKPLPSYDHAAHITGSTLGEDKIEMPAVKFGVEHARQPNGEVDLQVRMLTG